MAGGGGAATASESAAANSPTPPGGIKTPILGDFAPLPDGDNSLLMRLLPPMQRFGRAYEVAKLITYLASDDASYITGEALVIDGGSVL